MALHSDRHLEVYWKVPVTKIIMETGPCLVYDEDRIL